MAICLHGTGTGLEIRYKVPFISFNFKSVRHPIGTANVEKRPSLCLKLSWKGLHPPGAGDHHLFKDVSSDPLIFIAFAGLEELGSQRWVLLVFGGTDKNQEPQMHPKALGLLCHVCGAGTL